MYNTWTGPGPGPARRINIPGTIKTNELEGSSRYAFHGSLKLKRAMLVACEGGQQANRSSSFRN